MAKPNQPSRKAVGYNFHVTDHTRRNGGHAHVTGDFRHYFEAVNLIVLEGRSGGWLYDNKGFGANLDLYIKMTPDELADVRRLDGA